MRSYQRITLLALCNIVAMIAILTFMTGYFRGKPRSMSLEKALLKEETLRNQSDALFDRVIFMLIDALRSDFIYGENSGFEFTQSLIRSGEAIPFTAQAAAPTLTVSRLKALTQGTPQSFLDVWLNVMNSTDAMRLEGEDTWLSRLKSSPNHRNNLVYIGVDMWVMLYPDLFDRAEALPAYYLPDFRHIDASIIERLPAELARDDWASLVMHISGLDDIAHLGGIHSSHMVPKQKEMDNAVKHIYQSMTINPSLQNTLFVLLGDHGSTESGSHGGDTPAEIASAMVFMSRKFASGAGRQSPMKPTSDYNYYTVIQQVDLVPTLAGLLGFGIPTKSTGIFISDLLGVFNSTRSSVRFLYENAVQLKNAFDLRMAEQGYQSAVENSPLCSNQCDACSDDQHRVQCLWRNAAAAYDNHEASPNQRDVDKLVDLLKEFSSQVQAILSVPSNDLHFPLLALGLSLLCSALATLVAILVASQSPSREHYANDSPAFVLLMAAQAAVPFVPGMVAQEHLFWYPLSLLWLYYLGVQNEPAKASRQQLLLPIFLQFLTYYFDPSNASPRLLGRWMDQILVKSPISIWMLLVLPYAANTRSLMKNSTFGSPLLLLASMALSGLEMCFKMCSVLHANPALLGFLPASLQHNLSAFDRNKVILYFWTGLAILTSMFYARAQLSRSKDPNVLAQIVGAVNFYLMSQTRPRNTILYAIFEYQFNWLLKQDLSPTDITISGLILGHSAFFAFGRNNSFASVDLMNGYNGIDGTSVPPVFFQVLASNWVGPIWWSFACLRLLSSQTGRQTRVDVDQQVKAKAKAKSSSQQASQNTGKGHRFLDHVTLQTIFMAVNAMSIMLACIWLRNDQALWTVMAPKYVNVVIWIMFYHVVVNAGFCGVLWAMC